LFPFSQDFFSITIVAALLGATSGIGGGTPMTLGMDLAPDGLKGFFMGFWTTIGDIGSAVGPVILGIVADTYGLALPFYFVAALMILTAVTTQFFVKETLKKSKK
jgi:MFS family permease